MKINRLNLFALVAWTLGMAFAQTAWAQDWPTRQPLRIIVPYPTGGNADSAERAIAEIVSANIKQNIIIDNRPAGTPQPVVDRLSHEINAALRMPAMREKMLSSGDPYPADPTELAARLLRDIDSYGSVIQATLK